jgi:transcriptional regulator with XRE-family HTH domain
VATSHNRKKTRVRIDFGKRLRAKRQERGLTLEKLAEKADLAISYVASVERGERNLGLENIISLAQALNISPSELLPGAHHQRKDQIKGEFGKQLKSLREERGFSQEELAEKADLDQTQVSLLEQGEGNVNLETLITLAQVLKVPLKDLIPDIGLR